MDMEIKKTKTGISQAYWCDSSFGIAEFKPAELTFDSNQRETLSWFDNLFEGGILLPSGEGESIRPLTMLLSGLHLSLT
jgi:hypothetical protein